MRKTKEFIRGSSKYRMTQLGGYDVAEHATTVLNMAADLAPLLVSIKSGGLGGADVSAVRVDWGKVKPLLQAFAGSCLVVGKQGATSLGDEAVFDEHFAGDLDGMTELFLRGLELNFASFLEQRLEIKLSKLAELWAKAKQSASPSPTESPGTPGE